MKKMVSNAHPVVVSVVSKRVLVFLQIRMNLGLVSRIVEVKHENEEAVEPIHQSLG
jgi:hypothetical protein